MSSLSYNDLKPGVVFIKDGAPHSVMESSFSRMQQRKPVMQVKSRNVVSGKVITFTAQQSDFFEEAEIEKAPVKFVYSHRGEYCFSPLDNPRERFILGETEVGKAGNFLKAGSEATILRFQEKVLGVELPIKVELKVTEAPPSLKGNTAQGGSKVVMIETGARVAVPLFINAGDVIRINTGTEEYAERVSGRK